MPADAPHAQQCISLREGIALRDSTYRSVSSVVLEALRRLQVGTRVMYKMRHVQKDTAQSVKNRQVSVEILWTGEKQFGLYY